MNGNIIIRNAKVVTPTGKTAVKGKDMNNLTIIPNATVKVTEGIITYVGNDTCSNAAGYETLDAQGKVLLPGFVDSHTHLIFGGFRPEEFMWRMKGDSYMIIMERGGGIWNTVCATRQTSKEDLKEKARHFIRIMSRMGVTTVEGKSGYGLDHDTEIKQLEILNELNSESDRLVDISTTYLGAHALPREFEGRPDEYIDYIINEMLPEVKDRKLAENCDIFC